MDNRKYECPYCGWTDIQSVQFAYESGHARGNAVHTEIVGENVRYDAKTGEVVGRDPIYRDVDHRTYTITDLADKLSPPEPPTEPTLRQMEYNTWENALKYGGCLVPILLLVVGLTIAYFAPEVTTGKFPDHFIQFGYILLVLYLIYARIRTKKKNIALKEDFERRVKEYDLAMKKYKADYAHWKELFICKRCGKTFTLEENQ